MVSGWMTLNPYGEIEVKTEDEEMKPRWIAFDIHWDFIEAFDTEKEAREQAEERLEGFRGEYSDDPCIVGYAEIKAIAKRSGDKADGYEIAMLEDS